MPIDNEAASPVTPEGAEKLEPGVALCLSGGGYRAMLFHVGALWRLNELGIRTDVAAYDAPGGTLPCPVAATLVLAATKTRLERLPDGQQERLINWGYAVCDAGIRTHVDRQMPPSVSFPYPSRGVG